MQGVPPANASLSQERRPETLEPAPRSNGGRAHMHTGERRWGNIQIRKLLRLTEILKWLQLNYNHLVANLPLSCRDRKEIQAVPHTHNNHSAQSARLPRLRKGLLICRLARASEAHQRFVSVLPARHTPSLVSLSLSLCLSHPSFSRLSYFSRPLLTTAPAC